MKNLLLSSLVLVLTFSSCSDTPTKNEKNNKYNYGQKLQELNETIFKLESSAPQTPIVPLPPIDKIAGSRYIGMGEATHGTREFFQMKYRIFRYLVKKHGFRVFAIEADMGESVYIDRYVNGGGGNLEEIMKNKMHFWTWKTEEVKTLIQWIHDYNQKVPESRRLYYIGIDCQYMTYQPDLIENYFQKYKPGFVDEVNDVLAVIRELGNNYSQIRQSYKSMTLTYKNAVADTLDYLVNKMNNFKKELIAASSNYDYQFTYHLIRNLQQVNEVTFYYLHEGKNGGNLRDKFMAENVLWASRQLVNGSKVAVWAHNGHVAMSNIYEGLTRMGEHLKNALGNNYKTVGFSFSTGKFIARGYNSATGESIEIQIHNITTPPPDPSINGLFYKAKYDKFILNFDALPSTSLLSNWLSKEHRFLSIGAVFNGNPQDYYYDLNVRANFNVMIYFDETDYARSLYNLQNTFNQNIKLTNPML